MGISSRRVWAWVCSVGVCGCCMCVGVVCGCGYMCYCDRIHLGAQVFLVVVPVPVSHT